MGALLVPNGEVERQFEGFEHIYNQEIGNRLTYLSLCITLHVVYDVFSRYQQELPGGPAGEADDPGRAQVREPLPLHRGRDQASPLQ